MTDEDPSKLPGAAAPDPGRLIVAAVLFEAGLAPLALLIGGLLGHAPLEGFSWSLLDVALGGLAALPMYVLFRLLVRWPIGPLERIQRFFVDELSPVFGGRPITDLALISLAAGVGEEILFRGLVQGTLAQWLGVWEGLAVASLLFGLLHPISAAYVVIASLLGAYLGALWILSGNLLIAMIAHAVYDFLALRHLFGDRAPGADDLGA